MRCTWYSTKKNAHGQRPVTLVKNYPPGHGFSRTNLNMTLIILIIK